MNKNSSICCSCNSDCCDSTQEKKQLFIDFLYLDLSICKRCQGTENNLHKAINEVSAVLKAAGYEIIVNKINITSKELAIKYEFLSSPTIRINGEDIELEVNESSCKECGDLCSDDVDCRVWTYEGEEYTEPPKAMIINAILQKVYGDRKVNANKKTDYVLPNNLQIFFDGLNQSNN